MARSGYPKPDARGGGPEALPTTRGQEQWLGGTTLCPMPGVAAGRSNPTFKEPWLCGRRRAERSYSTLNVRRGGREEIPLVQGKEQWLRLGLLDVIKLERHHK